VSEGNPFLARSSVARVFVGSSPSPTIHLQSEPDSPVHFCFFLPFQALTLLFHYQTVVLHQVPARRLVLQTVADPSLQYRLPHQTYMYMDSFFLDPFFLSELWDGDE